VIRHRRLPGAGYFLMAALAAGFRTGGG